MAALFKHLGERRMARVHGGRVYASNSRFWAIVIVLVCTKRTGTDVQADGPSEPHRQHSESRCCSDTTCSSSSKSKFAFVTSIRTAYYMTGLRELHCSLRRSNPDIPLIVMSVDGDLDEQDISEIEKFAVYRTVQDIRQPPNVRNPRFGLNWMKLRAWELTEYDALIMLDADTAVFRDLSHLFNLPTDFAWAPYQGPNDWHWNAGGMMFLRPCQKLFDRMLEIIHTEHLAYVHSHAEQSFLQYFFQDTAMHLPMAYNLNFMFLKNGTDPAGEQPYVVHFANRDYKPFNATPAVEEWPYLCWQPKQHKVRRRILVARGLGT